MRGLLAVVALIPALAQQVPEIAQDIASVNAEIQAAEKEDARYSGGLVKSLIAARIGVLKQTAAMLSQRQRAARNGINLSYTANGTAFTPPANSAVLSASVAVEIAELDAKIEAQDAIAAKYSGGLVLAMTHSTIATLHQTRAMLDQKRLALKFGLPQFVGFQGTSPTSAQVDPLKPQAAIPQVLPFGPAKPGDLPDHLKPRPAAPAAPKSMEITDVDSRIVERNNVYWNYSWKLTIANRSGEYQRLQCTIEFKDSDQFVLDSDTEYDLILSPSETKTFTGIKLISIDPAQRVAGVGAKCGKR